MKRASPNSLAAAMRDYFTDHLPRLRRTSPHTIHSYRDSLILLLRFVSQRCKTPVTELDLIDMDPPAILAFLLHLEQERKNGASTRNVRLSVIHAFFRFVCTAVRVKGHSDGKRAACPSQTSRYCPREFHGCGSWDAELPEILHPEFSTFCVLVILIREAMHQF